jgi:hypothetical protein
MLLTLLSEIPSAVTQGTRVTVEFSLADESGNGLEGASVSLTIANTSITCTDLGDGIYTATIDTSSISLGAHNITISASKSGYEKVTSTHGITINRPILMMLIGAGGLVTAIAVAAVILTFRRANALTSEKDEKAKKNKKLQQTGIYVRNVNVH